MAAPPEKFTNVQEQEESPKAAEAGVKLAENPRTFSFLQRVQIIVASWAGYFAVLLIGRTLRWHVEGWENWEAAKSIGKGLIYTFWHREIFPATWFWRKRGIVVMTSQNFDGEYIARIIERHGYGAARGSSSRGAIGALAEMKKALLAGRDAAFTTDGPRGPRFVAKLGPVLLARMTGAAVLCFHVALRRGRVFKKSWDLHKIPYPFSCAAVFIAPPILVPPETTKQGLAARLAELQAVQEGLQKRGEEWSRPAGSRGDR